MVRLRYALGAFALVGSVSLVLAAGPYQPALDLLNATARMPFVGSIARSAILKMSGRIDLLDFGGYCDGTSHPLSATYSTLAAAQAAYPAATALSQESDEVAAAQAVSFVNSVGGGEIDFPAPPCMETGTLALYGVNNVYLKGKGKDLSSLNSSSATLPNITITNSGYTGVKDMTLNTVSGTPRSGGAGIIVSGAQETELERLQIYDQNVGVQFINSVSQWMKDSSIEGMTPVTGIGIDIYGGSDQYLDRNFIRGQSITAQPSTGIRIRKTGGVYSNGNSTLWAGTGEALVPAAGDTVANIFSEEDTFDTQTGNALLIQPAPATGTAGQAGYVGPGMVYKATFVQVWTATANLNGIALLGPGTIDGVNFVSPRVLNNQQHGMLLNGSGDVEITDPQILGNSGAATGVFDGIHVVAGTGSWGVIGGRIGAYAGYGASQNCAINVEVGPSDQYRVIGTDMTNNATAGMCDGGTGGHKEILGVLPQYPRTSYTPAISSATGAITSAVASGRYRVVDTEMPISVGISIVTNGSGATSVNFNLPRNLGGNCVLVGRDDSNGKEIEAVGRTPGTAAMTIQNYDGSYPGHDGAQFYLSGQCEIAP